MASYGWVSAVGKQQVDQADVSCADGFGECCLAGRATASIDVDATLEQEQQCLLVVAGDCDLSNARR